ncbi:MAG: tetratricopeptide repeat protein [Geobacteraceae bacterium]|nr:tetratricopeptide repeat protein [Geobacteraceae bacterium]
MKKRIICIAIIIGLSGCATIRKEDPNAHEQRQKLVLAKMLLQSNRTEAAKKTLTEITAKPAVAGITDEALFRLALLDLEAGQQKIATDKAGKALDTLLGKFRSSNWSAHATTLKGLIDAYDITLQEKAELDKIIKNLKSSNASLTKENADLRQDLEKIKKLDLELERKKK